jgi:hypothetical protein
MFIVAHILQEGGLNESEYAFMKVSELTDY